MPREQNSSLPPSWITYDPDAKRTLLNIQEAAAADYGMVEIRYIEETNVIEVGVSRDRPGESRGGEA